MDDHFFGHLQAGLGSQAGAAALVIGEGVAAGASAFLGAGRLLWGE